MKYVNYQKLDAVGVVTLAKPPHNLMDEQLLESVMEAYKIAVGENCRAILLRSDLRHFCVGADVAQFKKEWRGADQASLVRLHAGMEDLGIPTVAAVKGAALGGGFELALWCDFIIATETSFMGLPESSLGLIPLLGGVQRVAQRAGVSRAKEMAMLARRYDARTLEKWGVVNLVTSDAELDDVSMSYVKQLAAGATVSLNAIKTLADIAGRFGSAEADRRQIAINQTVWDSRDAFVGIDAYLTTGPGTAVFEGQ